MELYILLYSFRVFSWAYFSNEGEPTVNARGETVNVGYLLLFSAFQNLVFYLKQDQKNLIEK